DGIRDFHVTGVQTCALPIFDWNTHVILRHNDRRGPTGTLRPPLDFADDGSRVSLFAAIESDTAIGRVVQRMVTLTWLPSALRPEIGRARVGKEWRARGA